jgi:SAM-dependent methyltransferase
MTATDTIPDIGWRSFSMAEAEMMTAFADNSWFTGSYWPENRPRVAAMMHAAMQAYEPGTRRRVLDVGCANGYIALLARLLGYSVTAVDDWALPERDVMFQRAGIDYIAANLNTIDGMASIPSQSAEVVLFGEVFEHLLNAPSSTLAELKRLLVPNGLLVLTTPNPSTLMNAVRVLRDDYVLWGTDEFLRMPKITPGGQLTSYEGIHYREYPARIVQRELERLGFRNVTIAYVPPGAAPNQSLSKRIAKRVLRLTGLDRTRLLCAGYVLTARAL